MSSFDREEAKRKLLALRAKDSKLAPFQQEMVDAGWVVAPCRIGVDHGYPVIITSTPHG